MKRGRKILVVVLLMGLFVPVYGEEGDITTDVPGPSEYDGTIYGSMYSRTEEDGGGDIDIIVPPEPGDTGDTQKPGDEGNNGDQGNHGNQGNSGNSGSSNQGNGSTNSGTGSSGSNPNVPQGRRLEGGRDEEGVRYYEWQEERMYLTVYPAMFELAKQEEKNIVMRVVNEEGKMRYRVRMKIEDITKHNSETIEIDFGAGCPHRKEIEKTIEDSVVASLLQCQQKEMDMPITIGVVVEEAWNRDYGVYQYSYKENTLKLLSNTLEIDEEQVVEIEMKAGEDYVFGETIVPRESKSLSTFMSGLMGDSQIVDRRKASIAVGLLVVAIVLIGASIVYYRRSKIVKSDIINDEEMAEV